MAPPLIDGRTATQLEDLSREVERLRALFASLVAAVRDDQGVEWLIAHGIPTEPPDA